ncbi:MAG: lytic transglycosylase domain-containing protein [Bacillota bacterium]
MAASPAVLLGDIFNPENRIARRWLLGFIVLATLVNLSDLGVDLLVDKQTKEATVLLSDYSALRGQVKQLPYAETMNFYAARYDLDPALVAAVIEVESDFDPNAVSRAGARGLMQLSPVIWRDFNPGSTCNGQHDPPPVSTDCVFDPGANIRTGTAYLRELLDRFKGDFTLAFAAYNAGAGSVTRAAGISGGDGLPPFRETRAFVRDVLESWSGLRRQAMPPLPVEALFLLQALRRGLPFASLGLWGLFAVWAAVKWPKRHW